jgi:hypothetical protein
VKIRTVELCHLFLIALRQLVSLSRKSLSQAVCFFPIEVLSLLKFFCIGFYGSCCGSFSVNFEDCEYFDIGM